ncbi:MAG: polysaccharide deacetylase family protein [Novosphingobium sp.]|nr:polysaccharide deacetylase family protein [Novosphingobium sp.]
MNNPDPPNARTPAAFDKDFGQKFIITVDTEEEFDWDAPIRREGYGLETIPALGKFQQFCEDSGIIPIYLIDHTIATSPVAAEVLGQAATDGRAEIGVHLHPWVNPPFDEAVSEENSFAGNLSSDLESEKFRQLHDAISTNFGSAPLIYRAGRYGVGPNTAKILKANNIAIDTSVRTHFDYSHGGGPNFSRHPLHPYWIDPENSLLELPLTTIFWGPLRQLGPSLYPRLQRLPTVRGALAKSRMLERIPLTPEGISTDEALRGIDIALDEGLPVLVFSFHSPSLAVGSTPYVRSGEDLEAFYDWWRTILAYLAKRGVPPTSISDIMAAVSLA